MRLEFGNEAHIEINRATDVYQLRRLAKKCGVRIRYRRGQIGITTLLYDVEMDSCYDKPYHEKVFIGPFDRSALKLYIHRLYSSMFSDFIEI